MSLLSKYTLNDEQRAKIRNIIQCRYKYKSTIPAQAASKPAIPTMSKFTIPGTPLGSTSTHLSGPGTHLVGNQIIASLCGTVELIPSQSAKSKPTLSISRLASFSPSTPTTAQESSLHSTRFRPLPTLLSTVLVRITRVSHRQATGAILSVYPTSGSSKSSALLLDTASLQMHLTNTSSEDVFPAAILRREDIRLTEKDKVVMNDSVRVGDLVRAVVVSLGDERSYYVSTGGNELGVVMGRSEAGNALVPASWREMRDGISGRVEGRKVAKPV